MAEISDQRNPPSPIYSLVDKELTMTPAPYIYVQATRTPSWLTPSRGGSTLYDSYELKAVTQQLNRTIHHSQVMYSPYATHTKFTYPFRGYLDRVYQENASTPKRITGTGGASSTIGDALNLKGRRKFMPYMWKKLKLRFLGKAAPLWMCTRNQN